jgi:hypothetical protein
MRPHHSLRFYLGIFSLYNVVVFKNRKKVITCFMFLCYFLLDLKSTIESAQHSYFFYQIIVRKRGDET